MVLAWVCVPRKEIKQNQAAPMAATPTPEVQSVSENYQVKKGLVVEYLGSNESLWESFFMAAVIQIESGPDSGVILKNQKGY